MSYLAALLHEPAVASLTPSSRYLAERVVEAAAPRGAGLVVELGPGEGVITRRLLRALPPAGRLLSVELSADFMPALRRIRDPRLNAVHGDALDLLGHMARARLPRADAVVSGIPMSLLTPAGRRRVLGVVRRALKPGGRFVLYQLTPQLIPLLERGFRGVEVRFEWRNLPPLFVLSCRR
ncbi:methyltransferase domain-containing protein [bacterium]|nr:MAG: methyltransferase domain-containing protein [bacterium]